MTPLPGEIAMPINEFQGAIVPGQSARTLTSSQRERSKG
jgi:hypothetical protein